MKKTLYLTCAILMTLASCQAPSTPAATLEPPTPTVELTPFIGNAHVKMDDITVYFEAQGAGMPLILLHGGMGSANNWSNQVPVFSQQYWVITPDSRGQGRTTDSDAPLSYHLMAEDVVRLMDYLGIGSAYIVGWSDGGIIGLDLAIHHPDRIRALIAYGANISPDGLQTNTVSYLQNSSAEILQRDMGAEYLRVAPEPDHLPIIIEKIKTLWLTEPNFSPEELAGITTPTLIVDGQTEEVVQIGEAKMIADAIPGAVFELLPNVGHYALFKKPAEWNRVVLDFLKDK